MNSEKYRLEFIQFDGFDVDIPGKGPAKSAYARDFKSWEIVNGLFIADFAGSDMSVAVPLGQLTMLKLELLPTKRK